MLLVLRLLVATLAVVFLFPACSSLTLHSQAQAPETVIPTHERVLTSGDFVITSNLPQTQIAGDGKNERTTWEFTFRASAMQHVLKKSATLESAMLTLEIEPNGETNGVLFLMDGKTQLFTLETDELYPGLPDGKRSKVHANLPLAATNDDDLSLRDLIHQHIQAGRPLAFRYDDDARISLAKLKLEYK